MTQKTKKVTKQINTKEIFCWGLLLGMIIMGCFSLIIFLINTT